jgi:hypothetical protein
VVSRRWPITNRHSGAAAATTTLQFEPTRRVWKRSRNHVLVPSLTGFDPKRTRQMIRLADGVVFDYVVAIFNMVTSTVKDSNGA